MKYNSTVLVLFTAIVCATVALPAFAQTGEVYSLNVVGFQKLTASSNGMTMVSLPFVRTPNTLNDVITNQLYGHKSSTYADSVYLWDNVAQAYVTYFLKNDGSWYRIDGQPATNSYITPIAGFWVRNNRQLSNEVFVVSGDVVDDAVVTNPLVVGMNMVSYPFSTEIDINSSGLTNGFGHKSSTYADSLYIWDFASRQYITYFLKNTKVWCDVGSGLPASGVKVGGGKGFWYRNQGAGTFNWVEARPYTL